MNYKFHPAAAEELDESVLHYEREVPGLGRRFMQEAERVVQLILENPELGSRVNGQLRHVVLHRFHFQLFTA